MAISVDDVVFHHVHLALLLEQLELELFTSAAFCAIYKPRQVGTQCRQKGVRSARAKNEIRPTEPSMSKRGETARQQSGATSGRFFDGYRRRLFRSSPLSSPHASLSQVAERLFMPK
jgi:hypothetical protein